MPSWYPSWMPTLPTLNLSLPVALQSKFISFALKRALGQFIKPGQLDTHQIDTQIGSGFVEIKDLELDDKAINLLLSDLPLRLHDGFVSSLVVRIPWPNPLTSTVGVSFDSVHLVFHLLPTTPSPSQPGHGLADSVATISDSVTSVAESFVHDELSPKEGVGLFQSIRSNFSRPPSRAENLPGDINPFGSTIDDGTRTAEVDPAGVSIFATLFERLIARFEFAAANIKATIIDADNMRITMTLDELIYRTEAKDVPPGSPRQEASIGETRSLSLAGFTVAVNDLRQSQPQFNSGSYSTIRESPFEDPFDSSPPLSRRSSSSSLDEETHLAMSQSLAFLPPRPSSPPESVASSMYQSATSDILGSEADHPITRREGTPTPEVPFQTAQSDKMADTNSKAKTIMKNDDVILSFGSTPVVLRMTTPPPVQEEPRASSSAATERGTLETSLTMGVLAVSLRAWHLRGLTQLSTAFSSHILAARPPVTPPSDVPKGAPTIFEMALRASIQARGIVALVLPTSELDEPNQSLFETGIRQFYSQPLSPPSLPHDYVRLQLEGIGGSALTKSLNSPGGQPLMDRLQLGITLKDLSVLVFHPPSGVDSPPSASPIIITDRHLLSQYSSDHVAPGLHPTASGTSTELPMFEVVDWTRLEPSGSTKLSQWRTKEKHKQAKRESGRFVDRHTPSSSPRSPGLRGYQGNDAIPAMPALRLEMSTKAASHSKKRKSGSELTRHLEINISPLHLFVDLEVMLRENGLKRFFEDLTGDGVGLSPGEEGVRDRGDDDDDGDESDSPPLTPKAKSIREREMERKRLENLVLEDLDLGYEYQTKGAPTVSLDKRPKRRRKQITTQMTTSITLAMIRVEVRCPPPPSRHPRSGAFVLDLHKLNVTSGFTPKVPSTRFAISDQPETSPPPVDVLYGVELARIVFGYADVGESVARTFLSIGSLGLPVAMGGPDEELDAALSPRISITRTRPASSELPGAMVIIVDVPSIHLEVSKPLVDGLQYWADDIIQYLDRTVYAGREINRLNPDASVLGSRYFARSGHASSTASGTASQPGNAEMVIKSTISEAFIRVHLPRAKEGNAVRPFDIQASDLDVLVELKPEGKDQTVLTLGLLDILITNAIADGTTQTLLSLTSPRSLSSAPKPLVKLRFISLVVPGTIAKESRVKLTLWGFTFNFYPDFQWTSDLGRLVKSPPGAFEAVVPSERTQVSLNVQEGSIRAFAPTHPGAIVLFVGDLTFSTDIIGGAPETSFQLSAPALTVLALDNTKEQTTSREPTMLKGPSFWKAHGYAMLCEIEDLDLHFRDSTVPPSDTRVVINQIVLKLHMCADSMGPVGAFVGDLTSAFKPPPEKRPPRPKRGPTMISEQLSKSINMMSSIDDLAFRRNPDVGPAPDMINDDLPTNLDYIDESYGAAAGLRELRDDDLDEFDDQHSTPSTPRLPSSNVGIVSNVGGETIKMLRPEGIQFVEHHFDRLHPDHGSEHGDTTFRLRVFNADVTLLLYDGYDWVVTRRTIEDEVKEMRRRLAKIRQLVASGQTQDPIIEDTSALLYNSVYIGLGQDADEMEPGALIAAIDDELKEDVETASQSSWQSLRTPQAGLPRTRSVRIRGKRLTRSRGPSIEFRLFGTQAEVDKYRSEEPLVSRTIARVQDLEILDHIKTSTWKKFLTALRSDSRGNIRESDSNMVHVELLSVHPVPGHPSEEARLKAKILPLRLYVDQDALDFLKQFFSFQDQHGTPSPPAEPDEEGDGIYFQNAEIFPVDLKLDYKPRRVDYRALKAGKTIELMNFFHFDGAEMTLRRITLSGITGWPRLFDMLNDLWTPDVKATQLVEVISGVAPIRSVVNVGSGVADLVLLPIAQYRKDGRIVRGVQKGATAFVKSTAIEAIKLGARLATGTQVILEQAEGLFGGQFSEAVTTEAMQFGGEEGRNQSGDEEEEGGDLISKYAEQPGDLTEGMQSAYKSLQKNLNSAAQTILAVPMEVYERSGSEGPARSVIRAVPIAILKPMIGASEAVSKTLLGLHNTLDPNVRHENEAKYKQR